MLPTCCSSTIQRCCNGFRSGVPVSCSWLTGVEPINKAFTLRELWCTEGSTACFCFVLFIYLGTIKTLNLNWKSQEIGSFQKNSNRFTRIHKVFSDYFIPATRTTSFYHIAHLTLPYVSLSEQGTQTNWTTLPIIRPPISWPVCDELGSAHTK